MTSYFKRWAICIEMEYFVLTQKKVDRLAEHNHKFMSFVSFSISLNIDWISHAATELKTKFSLFKTVSMNIYIWCVFFHHLIPIPQKKNLHRASAYRKSTASSHGVSP